MTLEPMPAPGPSRTPAPVTDDGPGLFGAAALATDYADDLLVGTVRGVHEAVATRVFGLTNTLTAGASKPGGVIHDTISKGVYAGLSHGLRAGGAAFRAADRQGLGPRTEATPTGRLLMSAVNGLIGDRLVEEGSDAAINTAIRVDGRDVPTDSASLAETFPEATRDLVIFVHGLMEHERHWFRRHDELPSYGEALAANGSWTPVYLRVNTGLSLKENGIALSSLFDRMVANWPVPVRRIVLVGHSMGGLVLRAACAVQTDFDDNWTDRVTNVVLLGTPNLGAPLERLVAVGSRALGVLPESAPFGRILEYRSIGILDLRQGLAADVQNLPHARYHLVSATLGATPRHPLSVALGDLLVRHPSALGRGRHGEMFPGADVFHLPNADHFDLLNHPDIHQKLQEWLR